MSEEKLGQHYLAALNEAFPGVVLDHACMLTATEMENFRILQSRCEEATNP